MSTDNQHFVIIGAQRSGTTFLHQVLDAHPNISMAKPVKPEPKYFLTHQGDYDHYINALFRDRSPETKLLGEKSTSYYELSYVAERIKNTIPNAKIIVVLRNPVERALSNYFFSLKHGLETRSLSEVFIDWTPPPIVNQKTSVNPFNYLGRSDYELLLKPYKEAFQENLLILLFERLVVGQESDRLSNFLEISGIDAKRTEIVNDATRIDIPEKVTQRLNDHFSPKIKSLEQFLAIDLSIWK